MKRTKLGKPLGRMKKKIVRRTRQLGQGKTFRGKPGWNPA